MEIGGLEKYYYFKKLEWQSKKISNMNKSLSLGVKKKINIHEKIFYYYYVQYPFALYIHKVFILIEMQIFNFLVKVKIVPYIFLSKELCFYNLVFVNRRTIRDPYYIVGIYDTVMVPIEIYQYFFFPKSAFNYYSSYYYKFFKFYWRYFKYYTNNKVWLITNYLLSKTTGEVFVFDFPNLLLYTAPFRRFMSIFVRPNYLALKGQQYTLVKVHAIIKIKLFNFVPFYNFMRDLVS